MAIAAWPMLSETEIPGGRFGKRLVCRTFQNPAKGAPDDFIVFRSRAIPTIVFPVSADRRVVAVRMFRPASNSVTTTFLALPHLGVRIEA